MKRRTGAILLAAIFAGSAAACFLPGEPAAAPIEWRLNNESDIRVLSVVRYRQQSDNDDPVVMASLRIVVEGTWPAGPGFAKPQVIADGKELFVGGAGNHFTSGGPQTDIEADLPGGKTPRSVLLRLWDSDEGWSKPTSRSPREHLPSFDSPAPARVQATSWLPRNNNRFRPSPGRVRNLGKTDSTEGMTCHRR